MSFREGSFRQGGPVRYVEKDHRGVLEDSVILSSDQVKMRAFSVSNDEAGGAITDARAATKLTGDQGQFGPVFGVLTVDAAGNGTNGAEDACFFTFSESGIYQVSGTFYYTKAATWVFDDDAAITFDLNTAFSINFPVSFNGLMTASPNFTFPATAGDILYINNEAGTAGDGTLTQATGGYLYIYKLGEFRELI